MNKWILETEIDLMRVNVMPRFRSVYYGDAYANEWRCTVTEDGEAVDLTGYIAEGVFVRADNSTVFVAGSISDNVVTVVLPSACYAKLGMLSGTLVLEKNEDRVTIDAATFSVERTSTDAVVPVDESIVHIGTDPLTTSAQTITGAINELVLAVTPITDTEIDDIMT